MYRRVEMARFRGFDRLVLEPLDRVNLVVGRNNVGKTSLLEALFLLLGTNNPELSVRVHAFRGFDRLPPRVEELCGWLFHDRKVSEGAEVSASDDTGQVGRLSLRIASVEQVQTLPTSPQSGVGQTQSQAVTGGGGPGRLELTYDGPGATHAEGHASADADGNIKLTRQPMRAPLQLGVFYNTRIRNLTEDADRFSALEKRGMQDHFLPALRALEPGLKRLAVLSAAGAPVIHADVGLCELLPVPLLGDGFVRLLSVLLAISSVPGGIALIDEVENGLHYSALQRGLGAIAEAAVRFNVQAFITTHSYECLEAAHRAFSERSAYDLRVIQLFRTTKGVDGRVLDRDSIAAGIEGGIDLR